jgi:hypothetical protein
MKRKVHPANEIACLRLSLTGSGPAAYGHRRSSRKDLPGFVGRRPWPRRSLHSDQLCRVVERSLSWLSLYRRLNTVFDQTKEHLIALAEMSFVSILSRCLKHLPADELSARYLQTDSEMQRQDILAWRSAKMLCKIE